MNDKKLKNNIFYNVIFIFLNIIFWMILYYRMIIINQFGDYYDHNRFTVLMMNGKFETVYPGYQWIVGILYVITGINVEYISVGVMTVFAVFSVYVTASLLKEILGKEEIKNYSLLFLSFLLNIIQPIFTYSIRPGYSSGNGYISPTQALCKPFVILAFLVTYRMYKNNKYSFDKQVVLFILLFISCIIKPVFAMAFVPSLGILHFVDELINESELKEKVKSYIVKIWPLFLTGIVLIIQYLCSFNLKLPEGTGYSLNEGASIKIGFLVSWKSVVSSVPLSIIFAYFFPLLLLITIVVKKNKEANEIVTQEQKLFLKISLYYGAISFIYMSFLYQENHVKDCNFRNAWVVTYIIIYTLCISILYRFKREDNKAKCAVLLNWGAFSVHIIAGVALYLKNII